jgi:hypothetical protein
MIDLRLAYMTDGANRCSLREDRGIEDNGLCLESLSLIDVN